MVDYLNDNAGALTVIFTAVVTISTVVYAILTAKLVKETRQMRQAQTEPKIEITVKPKEEWINLIRLHIKNIGLGPAYNIFFDMSSESNNEGIKELIKDLTRVNFSNIGLKYLGPGQELIAGDTQLTKNFEEKINAVLNFHVKYQDSIGKDYQEKFLVDFSEFKGRREIGKPHLYSIADSLEAIKKSLGNIETGWKRLQIDIYNRQDREKECKEREEWEQRVMKPDKNDAANGQKN